MHLQVQNTNKVQQNSLIKPHKRKLQLLNIILEQFVFNQFDLPHGEYVSWRKYKYRGVVSVGFVGSVEPTDFLKT